MTKKNEFASIGEIYNKNLKLVETETKKNSICNEILQHVKIKVDIRNLKMCVFKENSFLSYSEITSK